MGILLGLFMAVFFGTALLTGAPLFTIIGGSAVLLFKTVAGGNMAAIISEMGKLSTAPGIIAIPLFIFAGFILAESNASTRLIKFSDAMLGWLPGGLAVVTIIVSTVFTAMTGGSGITIIACGGILFPALLKAKYDDDFSLGIVTSSASSGVLFVPSLPIIIYGMIAKVDIAQLFIAGAIPACLIMGVLIVYGIIFGAKNKIETTVFSMKKLIDGMWEIKWMVPLPFLVIGGIYGGIITVGEAASVTVVYVMISECLIYREIPFNNLIKVAVRSMVTVGSILVVLGTALGMTNFLVDQCIPQLVMEIITKTIDSKIVFLLTLNGFLLIVGCMMDIFSAIVVVVPLIAPVATEFGIDPLHLGVIFLANLTIGYITPPVGMNLFIASLRFDVSVIRLYKVVVPSLILFLIILLLLTYVPQISLFLIDFFGFRTELIML